MKKTIKLTESELHRLISEAINEVKYDGVSLHGTNPYDWAYMANIRRDRYHNAEQYTPEEEKELDALVRNKNNARQTGYDGKNIHPVEIENARYKKAKGYVDKMSQEKDPQKKSEYAKTANDVLGDVEGRGDRALRNMGLESKLENIVRESLRKTINEGHWDSEVYDKWEQVREAVGDDTMIRELYNYLSSDQIEDFIYDHMSRNFELGIE